MIHVSRFRVSGPVSGNVRSAFVRNCPVPIATTKIRSHSMPRQSPADLRREAKSLLRGPRRGREREDRHRQMSRFVTSKIKNAKQTHGGLGKIGSTNPQRATRNCSTSI